MPWTAIGRPGGHCLMSLWTISKIAEPQHWHRRLLTRCLPPPGGGRAAGARGGGEEEGGRSRTLFSLCSLQVAARIRHNKVIFVHLNHTMSTMFLVALLVRDFQNFVHEHTGLTSGSKNLWRGRFGDAGVQQGGARPAGGASPAGLVRVESGSEGVQTVTHQETPERSRCWNQVAARCVPHL